MLIAILLISLKSFSQQQKCEEVLKYGTYNFYESFKDQTFSSKLTEYATKTNEQWFDTKDKTTSIEITNFTATIGAFVANYNNTQKRDNDIETTIHNNIQEQYSKAHNVQQNDIEFMKVNLLNSIPYDAWKFCIEKNSGLQVPLYYKIQEYIPQENGIYTITIKFTPLGTSSNETITIKTGDKSSLISTRNSKYTFKGNGSAEFKVKVNSENDDASVIISSEHYSEIEIKLPGTKKYSKYFLDKNGDCYGNPKQMIYYPSKTPPPHFVADSSDNYDDIPLEFYVTSPTVTFEGANCQGKKSHSTSFTIHILNHDKKIVCAGKQFSLNIYVGNDEVSSKFTGVISLNQDDNKHFIVLTDGKTNDRYIAVEIPECWKNDKGIDWTPHRFTFKFLSGISEKYCQSFSIDRSVTDRCANGGTNCKL